MINKSAFFDIAKGSLTSLALFMAYILFMFAGPLIGIFAPFPALFYTLKSGRVVGTAIIFSASMVLFFLSPAGALVYLLQCGLFSMLLAEFLGRGIGASRSIAWTVAVTLVVLAILAASYSLWQGVDLNALVLKGINKSFTQTETYYKNSGLGSDELEVLSSGLRQAADFVGRTYPALIVVCIGAIAGLNLLLLKGFTHRLPGRFNLADFSRFKNPDKLIWVLIASGFLLLTDSDLVGRVALNLLIVTLSLYFVQGLAIASHLIKRFRVPRFITYLFFILLFVQPYLTVVVAAVGLFDLWCDFRAPKKQENL